MIQNDQSQDVSGALDAHILNNKPDDNSVVEIPYNEFMSLMEEIKKCRNEKDKLIDTVEFLNAEIQKYNTKFAQKER